MTDSSVRIAVIGGGVVGAGIAWQLASRDQRDVVLFERNRIASGATGRSIGGIRAVFTTAAEIAMSLHSRTAYRKLVEANPGAFKLHTCGYLLLASSEEKSRALQAAADLATAAGVRLEVLPPSRLAAVIPGVNTRGVRLAVLSLDDMVIDDPAAPARIYARMAAEAGAEIRETSPVTSLIMQGGAFQIRTPRETFTAERIVIALNAFAGPLLAMLGAPLACYPYPRHVFRGSPAPSGLRPWMPMTVFQDEDLLLRYDGSEFLTICGQKETSSLDLGFDPAGLTAIRQRVEARVPLTGSQLELAWSGIRGVTPDRKAIIGQLPGIPGAWVALGFSGHGLMHAPAAAAAAADLLIGDHETEFDLEPFRPGRFGAPVPAPPVLEPVHR